MSRTALAERFAAPDSAPLKTFVVEAHGGGSNRDLLGALADGGRLRATDDRHLYVIEQEDIELWVDTLDARFWSFHTWSAANAANRYLKGQLQKRRDLDWMWLPSQHLQGIWPRSDLRQLLSDFRGDRMLPEGVTGRDVRFRVEGADSGSLLEWVAQNPDFESAVSYDRVGYRVEDEHFGRADEALHRLGRFVAGGDSFELHQEFVRTVTERYAALVRAVEACAWSIEELSGDGFTSRGAPILIRYREIPDMEQFLEELFSAREPFRLWGAPGEVAEGVHHVDAVDLHVGQAVRIDVAQQWLRIYLPAGACGNSVVRLVSNLQHRFDGCVRFVDPALQGKLVPARNSGEGLLHQK